MDSSLSRFVEAQASEYQLALRELRTGKKRGHWMWYIFPQMRGLGRTNTSMYFGICDSIEAASYLAHPILGPRLVECTLTVLAFKYSKITDIFGQPDDLKFRSSMTLFALQDNAPIVFQSALDVFFNGETDSKTISLLRTHSDV